MLHVKSLYHVSAFRTASGFVRLTFDKKVKFYEAVAVPALAYGSEIWRGGGVRNETLEGCSRLHKEGSNVRKW
jgi:hypothetical protein